MSGQTGMTMERLIGVEVFLRLETNADFVEGELEDGRIRVHVTGVDPTLGLWVLTRKYTIKQPTGIETVAAQVMIPFRAILSIAMVDKSVSLTDEGPIAASLEDAMQTEGAGKEELEAKAAQKINCSRQSFRNAQLEKANLRGIVMRETDLERANLRGACLAQADLKDAQLREVSAERADFTSAYLWEAVLENANLEGAILKDANLYMANLKGCNLSKSDLTGANLVETMLTDAKLTGATIENVKLLNAKVSKIQATEKEFRALGVSLKKEAKEYLQSSYFTQARWCLEKAIAFFQQAKDGASASDAKNLLEDLEEEEKLSSAMQKG